MRRWLAGFNSPIDNFTRNGKTQPIAAWAKQLGISRQAMTCRVNECLRQGID
jgi:hypothetical protein